MLEVVGEKNNYFMEKYQEKCPKCGNDTDFIPPTKEDKGKRVLIVTFKCRACNHVFNKEFDVH